MRGGAALQDQKDWMCFQPIGKEATHSFSLMLGGIHMTANAQFGSGEQRQEARREQGSACYRFGKG